MYELDVYSAADGCMLIHVSILLTASHFPMFFGCAEIEAENPFHEYLLYYYETAIQAYHIRVNYEAL